MANKRCVICGEFKTAEHFDYGNRSNRSYCRSCNKIYGEIYSKRGLEGVHEWRRQMRAKRQ